MKKLLTATALLLAQHPLATRRRRAATSTTGATTPAPNCSTKFEAETGIKVTITDYDSNDTALAKIEAGGVGL